MVARTPALALVLVLVGCGGGRPQPATPSPVPQPQKDAEKPATQATPVPKEYAVTRPGLRDAIKYGDLPGVRNILKERPELVQKALCGEVFDPEDGWCAIHYAAAYDRVEIARLLIAAGATVDSRPDSVHNNTPLHLAVRRDQKGMVELLIKAGADVNALDSGGWTPLHLAAAGSRVAIAELLVAKGADVNSKGKLSLEPEPIFFALQKRMCDTGASGPASTHCDGPDVKMVQLLVANGAKVNVTAYEKTPLQIVREYNEQMDLHGKKVDVTLEKLLISKGAK